MNGIIDRHPFTPCGTQVDNRSVSLDTALTMLAYIVARHPNVDADIIKDAFALALSDRPTGLHDVDALYAQCLERAEILEGV
jgi:hypothetical protein